MPIHFIGRDSHFHGKSLYEIARNLRKFGEGRYVYRVSFSKRYEEPSFYKLKKVVPEMNAKGYCQGMAAGVKFFRGLEYGTCKIESGGKLDWRLIPKHEEQKWLDAVKACEQKPKPVVSSTGDLPSLMKLIYNDEKLAYEVPVEKQSFSKYDVLIKKGKFNKAVLDNELKQTMTE